MFSRLGSLLGRKNLVVSTLKWYRMDLDAYCSISRAINARLASGQVSLGAIQARYCHGNSRESEGIVTSLDDLTPEQEELLKVFKAEYDLLLIQGVRGVPEQMKDKWWIDLLNRKPHPKLLRKKFATYRKKENAEIKRKRNAENFRESILSRCDEDNLVLDCAPSGIKDGLRTQVDTQKYLNSLSNEEVIIDCGFEDQMVKKDVLNLQKHVSYLRHTNETSKNPFHLVFTNLPQDYKSNPPYKGVDRWATSTIHNCSYLDLYPREKLLYLTPKARTPLMKFDPSKIYIIGCINDQSHGKPMSYARAKRDGINTVRIPLDEYMVWKQGHRSFHIVLILKLLMKFRDTGDWEETLKLAMVGNKQADFIKDVDTQTVMKHVRKYPQILKRLPRKY